MKKVIFLLLFLQTLTYSCEICVLSTPKTEVSISIISDKTHIKKIDFTWIVSKEFTSSLNEIYDQNNNKKLDKNELDNIYKAFISYVAPKNYLTKIFYYEQAKNKHLHENILLENSVYIKNTRLHLSYNIEFKKEVKNNFIIEIEVFDENQYFDLNINENYASFDNVNHKIEKDLRSLSFTITKDKITKEKLLKQEITVKKVEDSYLKSYSLKIKEYLQKIKETQDISTLFFLLFISFIYGIFHALGPGHGKTLAFSYFLVHKTSVQKAFLISLTTAFIHILGAFILVLISVFILESFLNSFINDSVLILTKISASFIIFLGLFMLYNKVYKKSCICYSCKNNDTKQKKDLTKMHWSNQKIKEVNTKRSELYFVLSAGLIPCPGTVVLFIYAFVLKTYTAVILASIFISLGMALVIFASAFLGLGFKQLSHNSHKISQVLEYFAIILMLSLGIVLYFSF